MKTCPCDFMKLQRTWRTASRTAPRIWIRALYGLSL